MSASASGGGIFNVRELICCAPPSTEFTQSLLLLAKYLNAIIGRVTFATKAFPKSFAPFAGSGTNMSLSRR